MPFLSLSPWQAAETGRSLAYSACSMNNLFIPFAKERRRHISTNIHYNHFEIILRVAAKIITFSYHSYKSRPKTNNSKRQEPKRCISHTLTKIHTLRFIVCFYVLFFFQSLRLYVVAANCHQKNIYGGFARTKFTIASLHQTARIESTLSHDVYVVSHYFLCALLLFFTTILPLLFLFLHFLYFIFSSFLAWIGLIQFSLAGCLFVLAHYLTIVAVSSLLSEIFFFFFFFFF